MKSKTQPPAPQPASSRRLVWIAVVIALALGAVALFAVLSRPTSEGTGTPTIQVQTNELDFGDVAVNTPINAVYTIQNVGDAPLRILGEPRVELVRGC